MPRFISTLFTALPFINLPDLFGWAFFASLLGVAAWLYISGKAYRILWERRTWLKFSGLFLLTIFGNLFIGVYIKTASQMSWPGIPFEFPGMALMVFGALGWMLAGGTLGPLAAFTLGVVGGLLRAPFDTHIIFTPLQFGILAMLFNMAIRQRYRTFLYKALRQPFLAALALLPLYSVLSLPNFFFSATHPEVAARLDFAINNTGSATLAMAGELLIAGAIAQILAIISPAAWGRNQALRPSPAERKIETRFLQGMSSFIIILLLSLLVGDWIVAGQAAQRMLKERLENTAQILAESIPFFLETGQNLGVQLAKDPLLLSNDKDELEKLLDEKIRLVPYFNQLFIIDTSEQILGEYPPSTENSRHFSEEEKTGIILAAGGIPIQIYTTSPITPGASTRVSFLFSIPNDDPTLTRVLIGRTDLTTNPIMRPLLNSLDSMISIEGEGLLIDENNSILYHSDNNLIMNPYEGTHNNGAQFFESISSTGIRELVFYQPVLGRSWAVVLKVPASQVQQLALKIAAPLSTLILSLTLIALILLRLGLRIISNSLENLANEAGHIAQGKLDHTLEISGTDELGQLRRAFEQMRISLKDRLEELNRLLIVSRSIASSLEMKDIFQPVLEAIKSTGANTVQVVLSPEIAPDSMTEIPTRFAIENTKGEYAHLDMEIYEAIRNQEQLILPNLSRSRGGLQLSETRPNPAALFAIVLRNEKRVYGILWAAYDKPKLFTEADIRFITTLGGQAALAAANAHLFLSVEVGRQQLASILDSTSDPVLVTDHKDRLLLANPAAWNILGVKENNNQLKPIAEILSHAELIELLKIASSDKEPVEINLENGKTFLATASSVIAEKQPIGRVCILRDVTHFKELDTLKSEFVSTVSHDLRSPLTLMRGYATMMEMAGNLNDQQQNYVRKIITGVENMSRLVNNLLDLGRIELGIGLEVEKVPVLDILDHVISALQLKASEKRIEFTLDTAPNLPVLIEADKDLLQQSVYNLVENALKYTPEKGFVSVHAYPSEQDIIFEIKDSGIGISVEAKKHLFEKFFRSPQREARAQQGTGLGLAIARSIAERHGGRVWVESKEGRGSIFTLQVPITQPKGNAT
ncbi:MAG: HAMP domain-containing protein [Anaerolineae bacterium]|nr:HAMP domain-containing protein [Anaerolineae bacterium]